MQPSQKSESIDEDIQTLFGHDRRAVIKSDICVPAPIGCGGAAGAFRDAISRKEYRISGLCQNCQDRLFGFGAEL